MKQKSISPAPGTAPRLSPGSERSTTLSDSSSRNELPGVTSACVGASNRSCVSIPARKDHMPTKPTNIVEAFAESNCTELFCTFDKIRLSRSTVAKIRGCFRGKGQHLPFRFAGRVGDNKKIGVFAELNRAERDGFRTFLRWFPAPSEPPAEFAKYFDFLEIVGKSVGETEAFVSAKFSYDREKVSSIFTPIQLGSETTIFDEIVGFAGVKRTPEGKLLYMLEASLDTKRIGHVVRFFQTVRLSEELPLILLDIAVRISSLGLKKRD